MSNLSLSKFERVHLLMMNKYSTFADPNTFEVMYDRASLIHPYWYLYSDDYQAQVLAELFYDYVMSHKKLIID